jgi:hypothetical protein
MSILVDDVSATLIARPVSYVEINYGPGVDTLMVVEDARALPIGQRTIGWRERAIP